ncbi:T9SS type A sorting domain-containing protein [Flavobacterium faecale]|uniref:T9SS type A sorting domain-containing protein n=1 Tax=Flavobacterium faecale TaxID=1355330 RepID=UPI003AAB66A6
MKKHYLLILLLAISVSGFGQIKWVAAGSGDWGTASNWSGGVVPTIGDDVVLDNSTTVGAYTVTMPGNGTPVEIKSLQIGYPGNVNVIKVLITNDSPATGSILKLNGGGATALHITDNGVLQNEGSKINDARVVALSSTTDIFKMSGNAKYIHKMIGGSSTTTSNNTALPSKNSTDNNYDFGIDSTVEVQVTGGATTSLRGEFARPTYGNFTVIGTTSINFFGASGTNETTINGNLTIGSGAGSAMTLSLGSSNGGTLTVEKNIIINADAELKGANGTGAQTLIVKGDVTGDGRVSMTGTTSSGLVSFTLQGNLNARLGGIASATGQNSGNILKFSGGAVSNVNFNATNLSGDSLIKNIIIDSGKNVTLSGKATFVSDATPLAKSITINSGGSLIIGTTGILNTDVSKVTGAGTLVVNGTLGIGSLDVSNAFSDNINPTTVTLNPTANIELNGTAAQKLAARTFPNLTINNAAGVTLGGVITVTDKLNIATGILNLGSFTHTADKLYTAGVGTVSGSWGSESSSATNKSDVYFAGSGLLNVTATTLSVAKNNIQGLNVYPNPVKDGILFINTNSSDAKTVAIYDILGKQVVSKEVASGQVDVSSLNKGIYVLKITEAGKTSTRKIVIE